MIRTPQNSDRLAPHDHRFFDEPRGLDLVDCSQDRQVVYNLVRDGLAEFTTEEAAAKPLTERAEMLLGLRPFPKEN